MANKPPIVVDAKAEMLAQAEAVANRIRAERFASYAIDVMNWHLPKVLEFLKDLPMRDMMIILGWLTSVGVEAAAGNEEKDAIRATFSQTLRLSSLVTRGVMSSGEVKPEPGTFPLVIPPPTGQLTQAPELAFYLADPVGPVQ